VGDTRKYLKEEKEMANCPKCNYQWVSRVKNPKACPRCKSRLDAPKKGEK